MCGGAGTLVTKEALKELPVVIFGCATACFASVWAAHGHEHALKPSVIAATAILGILLALLNLVFSRHQSVGMTDLEMRKIAFTPRRGVFYALGLLGFGLIVTGLGYI